jgi:protein CsiD
MLCTQETPITHLTQLKNLMRIHSIHIKSDYIIEYLNKISVISIRDLEHIPYFRFLIAREFESMFQIKDILLEILNDYNTGALLLNLNNDLNEEHYVKLSTAISHLLGIPDIDPLSGKYYATFTVTHTGKQLPSLLRPYETFKMHTDGAYMKKIPDWIFFMKMAEVGVTGGQSRLLHIEDWNEFDYFYHHPANKNKIKFFSHPDSNTTTQRHPTDPDKNNFVYSSILDLHDSYKSIRFIDRFMHPNNLAEAEFIFELQSSLENNNAILEVNIPVGSMLIVNNHHWLHGRKQFQINETLNRKLMRQRGQFIEYNK